MQRSTLFWFSKVHFEQIHDEWSEDGVPGRFPLPTEGQKTLCLDMDWERFDGVGDSIFEAIDLLSSSSITCRMSSGIYTFSERKRDSHPQNHHYLHPCSWIWEFKKNLKKAANKRLSFSTNKKRTLPEVCLFDFRNLCLRRLAKFIFINHHAWREAGMFMILFRVVRIAYSNGTAYIIGLWNLEGLLDTMRIETTHIQSAPTLALSKHYELLHKETSALVGPSFRADRFTLVVGSCKSFLHMREEWLLLQEERHYF